MLFDVRLTFTPTRADVTTIALQKAQFLAAVVDAPWDPFNVTLIFIPIH